MFTKWPGLIHSTSLEFFFLVCCKRCRVRIMRDSQKKEMLTSRRFVGLMIDTALTRKQEEFCLNFFPGILVTVFNVSFSCGSSFSRGLGNQEGKKWCFWRLFVHRLPLWLFLVLFGHRLSHPTLLSLVLETCCLHVYLLAFVCLG